MSYSVTCSTKIITLAIALIWFILVDNICEFCGARCVHFVVPSGRRGTLFSRHGTDVNIQQTDSTRLTPLYDIMLICQGYC